MLLLKPAGAPLAGRKPGLQAAAGGRIRAAAKLELRTPGSASLLDAGSRLED